TPEEARSLIKNSNELLAMLLIFLFNTGLRINEALNLLYTDIATDLQSKIKYITIRKEISKNKKDRMVPLSKEAMEQINKMKIKFPDSLFIFVDSKGTPYQTTPKKALETAKRKAGLNDIGGFHITRHTAGSWWLQGVNLQGQEVKPLRIELVKELLGHSTVLITEKHYAKLCNQNILVSLENR
ncbi:MAG TPA: site-specific integrase, partial [Rickettsiales bacterium]|nr:site-specific integrase [Rickettsiales bacterium]